MSWISNHKHKIEEKSTKSSQSSSKVVSRGPVGISNTATVNALDISTAVLYQTIDISYMI